MFQQPMAASVPVAASPGTINVTLVEWATMTKYANLGMEAEKIKNWNAHPLPSLKTSARLRKSSLTKVARRNQLIWSSKVKTKTMAEAKQTIWKVITKWRLWINLLVKGQEKSHEVCVVFCFVLPALNLHSELIFTLFAP